MKIPEFTTTKELFDFLIANKSKIISAKKDMTKHADGIAFIGAGNGIKKGTSGSDNLEVKAMINSTNWFDSHKDVHINGLWKKSLSENQNIMHLKEHIMSFDTIIADGEDLKAYVKDYSWKELGYKYEGKTEGLIFESDIAPDRPLFKEYKSGRVKNHSVGMRYIKVVMCINSEDYPEEFAAWEKYSPMIANIKETKANGYFYAVTEAKVIEGSAVPIGSNTATPTLEIKEPSGTPKKEPPKKDTQKTNNNLIYLQTI